MYTFNKTMLAALVLATLAACDGTKPKTQSDKPKTPPMVPVTRVQQGDLPQQIGATGQVTPLQLVEVRPQLAGQVKQVLIREGQQVKAGQPLFLLEDGSERAALEKARAQKARNEALLAEAQRTLARNRSLLQQNYVAPSAVDSAASEVDSLKAAIAADSAAIRAAEVELGYRTVSARIGGRSGAIQVYPGSVVTPTQATPMTTIAQLDPIAVGFSVAESALPALLAAGTQRPLPVLAWPAGQGADAKPLSGTLEFIDNTVDSRSGTIRLKAQFDNAAGRLWPGMYVTLQLQAGVWRDARHLPVTALQSGPEGKFVFVVGAGNKLQPQPVGVLAIRDERAIVSGVAADTPVVAAAGANLRPGDAIKPKFIADQAGARP